MRVINGADILKLGKAMAGLEALSERFRQPTEEEVAASKVKLVEFLTAVIENLVNEKGAAYLATVPPAQLAEEMVAGIQVVRD